MFDAIKAAKTAYGAADVGRSCARGKEMYTMNGLITCHLVTRRATYRVWRLVAAYSSVEAFT